MIMVFSIGVDFSLNFNLGLSMSYPQSPSSSSSGFAVQVITYLHSVGLLLECGAQL